MGSGMLTVGAVLSAGGSVVGTVVGGSVVVGATLVVVVAGSGLV